MNITPSDPLSKVANALREHASPTPTTAAGERSSTAKKKTPKKTPNQTSRYISSSAKKYPYQHHRVASTDFDDDFDDDDDDDNKGANINDFVSPIVDSESRIRSVLFSNDSKKFSRGDHHLTLQSQHSHCKDNVDDNDEKQCIQMNSSTGKESKLNTFQTPSPFSLHKIHHSHTRTPRACTPRASVTKTPNQSLFSPTLSQPNTTERNMIKKFDDEYKQSLLDEAIGTQARQESVRNITLFTIGLFALYLTLGCFYYSVWEESQWPIEESLIFLIYTVTTVGYGNHDIPSSPRCRVFTMLFILFGIGLVTVFFSEIFQFLVIKAARAQYIHDEERITLHGLKAMQAETNHNEVEEEVDNDNTVLDVENQQHQQDLSHVDKFKRYIHMKGRQSSQIVRFLFCNTYSTVKMYLKNTMLGRYFLVLFPFVSLLLVGSLVVGCIEGWSAIDSLYWAVVTLTTVGACVHSLGKHFMFALFHLIIMTRFTSMTSSPISHFSTSQDMVT